MPVEWTAYLMDKAGNRVSEGIPAVIELERCQWYLTRGITFPNVNATAYNVSFVDGDNQEMCWLAIQAPLTGQEEIQIRTGPLFTLTP